MAELTDRGKAFRSAIAAFIEARRKAKLKGKEGDAETALKYGYETWLADAAARAHNLQVVTHPIKFTHSSIKGGSSIYSNPSELTPHSEIGTHSLVHSPEEDFAISDAKHLDVQSLLKEVVDEKRLLDWIREDDADLASALHDDPAKAEAMLASFKRVVQPKSKVVSSTLAKQVYWLHGDDVSDDTQYHLLQPMFSSSLEHAVHGEIRSARSAAFEARGTRQQKPNYADHSTYPGLVERTIGGSNPQNVSPLNKVRGGINYLLASLPPPRWNQDRFRNLLALDSALDRFAYFTGVRPLVKTLIDFLLSNPDRNMQTRDRREAIEQALGLQLPVFAASIQAGSEPGWSRDPDCRLPLCEQLWLDPERTELPPREGHEQEDADFKAAYERGDWPDEVAGRFANWVNAQLREAGLPTVDDAEHKHWARQAIVDAAWPVPLQRRAPKGGEA